jgi:predicted naringenin-chalcone synthase
VTSILGLGTATPAHAIEQSAAAEIAVSICAPTAEQARLVPILYRRSTIHRRASVLLQNGRPDGRLTQSFFPIAGSASERGPGTAARLDRYAAEAPRLAESAAAAALDAGAIDAAQITHLITVSCTGFSAPGIDAALISRLHLPATVQRTHIGFMGCHGAINGLRVAHAFATADPAARILLSAVELCSLHFQYTTDPEKTVANALFADGAAAAVVGPPPRLRSAPRIAATGSCLIPGSLDAMTWRIGDHGFEMTLSPRVPSLLESHLLPWLTRWLASHDLEPGDIRSYAIHPGGPRVLSTVGQCLGLPETALEASRSILAEHGNMSSPTVLFIFERLLAQGAPLPCLCLAFGPGLVAEAALIA